MTAPQPGSPEASCTGCGRPGGPAGVAGWTFSRPPRPVGATRPRTPEEERVTALCPDCSRRYLRDLEARLDP